MGKPVPTTCLWYTRAQQSLGLSFSSKPLELGNDAWVVRIYLLICIEQACRFLVLSVLLSPKEKDSFSELQQEKMVSGVFFRPSKHVKDRLWLVAKTKQFILSLAVAGERVRSVVVLSDGCEGCGVINGFLRYGKRCRSKSSSRYVTVPATIIIPVASETASERKWSH